MNRKQIIVAVALAVMVAACAGFGILYLTSYNFSTTAKGGTNTTTTSAGTIFSTTLSPNPGGSSSMTSVKTAEIPQRSGPVSTYPASWGLFSSCPGFPKQGNITTLGMGNVTYPDSWNTTTIITLNQVYLSIINSPTFENETFDEGWVVYSWSFAQGGSSNSLNGSAIVGNFILTNSTKPNGYLTAYFDIENNAVVLSTVTSTVTVNCPSFSSSRTTSQSG